jgi:hypothetical protein
MLLIERNELQKCIWLGKRLDSVIKVPEAKANDISRYTANSLRTLVRISRRTITLKIA